MRTRTLGKSGLEVSALGLGCMGMSWSYSPDPGSEGAALAPPSGGALRRDPLDTAEVCGPLVNEEVVGEALAPRYRSKTWRER
jgi:aryl-alcohol dehydrogenase-like predicted oxidoreductase